MENARSYPEHPPAGCTPAVSHSSINAFGRCERRWGYQYLTKFLPEGVYETVDVQKRIQPASSLAGSIFHLVCESAARDFLATGDWPVDLVARASQHYRGFVHFSRFFAQSLRDGLGIVYDDDYQAIDAVVESGALDKHAAWVMASHLKRWLANFDAFAKAELLPVDRGCWRLPERGDKVALPWFWGGTKADVAVYSVYDLAIVDSGRVTIYDWKTGMRTEASEDAARRQLALYAAFAMSHWNADIDSIQVVVYWPDEPEVDRSDVSEKQMAALAEQCDRYRDLFQERKRMAFDDQAGFLDRMAVTETVADCQRCPFTLCSGKDRLRTITDETPDYNPFDEA